MFSVDPPSFANDLQVVHANRWSNVNVELPATIDPNGLNWTISLDPSIPAWIILDNRILTLKTTNFNYNISETTIVSLKIVNEKKRLDKIQFNYCDCFLYFSIIWSYSKHHCIWKHTNWSQIGTSKWIGYKCYRLNK